MGTREGPGEDTMTLKQVADIPRVRRRLICRTCSPRNSAAHIASKTVSASKSPAGERLWHVVAFDAYETAEEPGRLSWSRLLEGHAEWLPFPPCNSFKAAANSRSTSRTQHASRFLNTISQNAKLQAQICSARSLSYITALSNLILSQTGNLGCEHGFRNFGSFRTT